MQYVVKLFFLCILFAWQPSAGQEDSFLCIADRSVGFVFDESNKSWKNAIFDIDDDKYIVRPASKDNDNLLMGAKYGVWEFGGSQIIASYLCQESFTEAGWLNCGDSFKMNRLSGRYIITYIGLYVASTLRFEIENGELKNVVRVPDTGGDTPYIEIGTCSKI